MFMINLFQLSLLVIVNSIVFLFGELTVFPGRSVENTTFGHDGLASGNTCPLHGPNTSPSLNMIAVPFQGD